MIHAERLRELLHYEPATGIFTWRTDHGTGRKGDMAGQCSSLGYRSIRIDGNSRSAARLAYLYVEGVWPPRSIDHINRVRDDDRWSNLRLATQSQQIANTGPKAKNATGFKGSFFISHKRYGSSFVINGEKISLGDFPSAREAALAHDLVASIFDGEFAYLNFPDELPRSLLLSDRKLSAEAWRQIALARSRYEGKR